MLEWPHLGKICVSYGIYSMIGDWTRLGPFYSCLTVMTAVDMSGRHGPDGDGGLAYDATGMWRDFHMYCPSVGDDHYYRRYLNSICVPVVYSGCDFCEAELSAYDASNAPTRMGPICVSG